MPRLAIRHAKKALEHLIGRNWIAVPRQGFGMGAAGNHFAVDQHAVTIEDDEVETPVAVLTRLLHASRFPPRVKRGAGVRSKTLLLKTCCRPKGCNRAPAGDRPACSRACGRSRP